MKSKIDITPPSQWTVRHRPACPRGGGNQTLALPEHCSSIEGSVVKFIPRLEVAVPTRSAMVARVEQDEFEV